MESKNSLIVGSSVTAVVLFTWEHYARVRGKDKKPSVAINYVADKAKTVFTKLGEGIATISSFYQYLHLDELCNTGYDLCRPVGATIISPYYTLVGYYKKSENKLPIIAFGTVTIVGVTGAVCYYFGSDIKSFINNHVPIIKSSSPTSGAGSFTRPTNL
jgi:hypothetical protein